MRGPQGLNGPFGIWAPIGSCWCVFPSLRVLLKRLPIWIKIRYLKLAFRSPLVALTASFHVK